MPTRPESETDARQDWRNYTDRTPLKFKRSRLPIETIELDLDSLHRARSGSGFSFIDYPLANYAEEYSDVIATIYTYETFSSNFQPPCNAVFFGVIGNNTQKILEIANSTLCSLRGVHVRAGESIRFEEYQRILHIEDGRLWAPYEAGTWYSHERDD